MTWPGFAALRQHPLLFVVVSSNAVSIISLKEFAVVIIIVELSLNLFDSGLACLTKIVFKQQKRRFSLLFIASTKGVWYSSAPAPGYDGIKPGHRYTFGVLCSYPDDITTSDGKNSKTYGAGQNH